MNLKTLLSGIAVIVFLTLFCGMSLYQLQKSRIDRLANLTARQLS